MKKLRLTAMILTAAIGVTASFAACNFDENEGGGGHTHTYSEEWSANATHHWKGPTCNDTTEPKDFAAHSFGVDGKCTSCGYEQQQNSISFNEFLQNHKDKAVDFVSSHIAPRTVDSKEVLGRDWYVCANEADELSEVVLVYVYTTDDTKRTIEIANVEFATPIDLDDIVNGTVDTASITLEINKTTAFEFDAKENYLKPELSTTLYNVANVSSEELKLFIEIDSPVRNARFFDIYTANENGIEIIELGTRVENSSDETVIKNLNDSNRFYGYETVSSYTFNGVNILNESYTLEKFEGEIEEPDPEKPGPGEEVTITDAEIQQALNEKCADGVINKSIIGITVNKGNISNANWYISTNTENKITRAEYSFVYNRSETSAMYIIGSATFSSPISREDLKNGNIGNVTYKSEYTLNYNPAVQESRKNLTNAIFEALGVGDTGAERIYVSVTTFLGDVIMGNGEYYGYKVAEISKSGVKEYMLITRFIDYGTDNDYIRQIENGEWRRYESDNLKSYAISGTLLFEEEK